MSRSPAARPDPATERFDEIARTERRSRTHEQHFSEAAVEIFPLWIIRKFSVSVSSLRFPQKKGHPLPNPKTWRQPPCRADAFLSLDSAERPRLINAVKHLLTNVFLSPPPSPRVKYRPPPPGSAVGVVDRPPPHRDPTFRPPPPLGRRDASAHRAVSGVHPGVAIPAAIGASAVDRASVTDPRRVPNTRALGFTTSARLSRSRGSGRRRSRRRGRARPERNDAAKASSPGPAASGVRNRNLRNAAAARFERRFEL